MVSFFSGFFFLLVSLVLILLSLLLRFWGVIYFMEWEFLDLSRVSWIYLVIIDSMGLSFMGLVLFISSIVMFYRTFYVSKDTSFVRFIILVALFVASIILIIISPNIIRILLGWDGLGLVSYCLIIFYENKKSSRAGMLTILSNRVGDILILLSIGLSVGLGRISFFYFQGFSCSLNLIFLFLVLAAITKRAQIPFSAWLPAAMAAPTPVSALVHSSTLVTAGVYILIRLSMIVQFNYLLFVVALSTLFISGVGANFEIDLKKIIALSTLSQLGLIMISLSFGFRDLAFFHLISHALFKSLLFLCAGVFIHRLGDWQDVRLLQLGWIFIPSISFFFLISSLSLCGFPFLSGFYSKDYLLEFFFIGGLRAFIFLIVIVCILLTLIYRFRLFLLIYKVGVGSLISKSLGDPRGIGVPIFFLFVMSISGGWILVNISFPTLFIYLPLPYKMLIFMVRILTSLVFLYFVKTLRWVYSAKKNMVFLGTIWNLPFLSTIFFNYLVSYGLRILKILDQGWVEAVFPKNFYSVVSYSGGLVDATLVINLRLFFSWVLLLTFLGFILL